MDHGVDLAAERWLEGALEAGEEAGATATTVDARAQRQVEPQVGVGHEQHPQGRHTHRSTACSLLRESRA